MREFYGADDIKEIIGCSIAKAYKLIRELIEDFKREYPNTKTIQGRIPIWFFEERVLGKCTK